MKVGSLRKRESSGACLRIASIMLLPLSKNLRKWKSYGVVSACTLFAKNHQYAFKKETRFFSVLRK